MSSIHVFFFRGLSTSGSDQARFSRLDFGPMCRHLQAAFDRREVKFHPVNGMGRGGVHEMTIQARAFLDQHPVWRDNTQPVHFLGHSAGGLVARNLLQSADIPKDKVLSLLTIASPHAGAHLATICLNLPQNYPWSNRALELVGFHMSQHRDVFQAFTREGLASVFTKTVESLATARVGSIVCAAPKNEWCLPLRLVYLLPAFRDFTGLTDGMIERDTQPYGEVIAELKIDHLRQVGFFGQHHRFQQLCDVTHEFFVKAQRQ